MGGCVVEYSFIQCRAMLSVMTAIYLVDDFLSCHIYLFMICLL